MTFEIEPVLALAWKVTVVLACGALLTGMLRRRSAAERHMVWLLTAATCLVLPAANLLPVRGFESAIEIVVPSAIGGASITPPGTATANSTVTPQPQGSIVPLAGALWSLGFLLVLAYFVAGRVILATRLHRNAIPAPAKLRNAVEKIAGELRIARKVRVFVSSGNVSPMTWGIVRPAVLLPSAWQNWTEERLRVVLIHELGHILRWDSLAQTLGSVAAAAYWFHPLAWWMFSGLRREQEKACDDLVLRFGCPASRYAEHLLEIAAGTMLAPSAAIPMAQPSTLESRIVAALNPDMPRRTPRRWHAVAVSSLLLTIALTGAGVRLMGQPGGAGLEGSVVDPSGAAIPEAEVALTFADGKRREVTATGPDGEYRFEGLPAGVYVVEVRARGFAVLMVPNTELKAGESRRLVHRMMMGRISETIQVVGKRPATPPPVSSGPPRRIRVGGSVQATKILRMVKPTYPEVLQQTGVEGTVLLRGVISTSGKLLSLESLNSLVHPDLTKAAIDAVGQWEYQPTLLNGQPVEVITTITVNFKLAP